MRNYCRGWSLKGRKWKYKEARRGKQKEKSLDGEGEEKEMGRQGEGNEMEGVEEGGGSFSPVTYSVGTGV